MPSKFLSSPWIGKIKRVAAAGFYIPLAPPLTQKNFSHSYKVFCATYTRTAGFCSCKSFILCILQPTKSACSAATENGLSGVGLPLSVSGRKRYNTLDFASKIVCQQGCYPPPIGNPEPKGLCPSGRPACPCSGDPSCSHTIDTLLPGTGKTGPEVCPNSR